jgi:hypothetical protein
VKSYIITTWSPSAQTAYGYTAGSVNDLATAMGCSPAQQQQSQAALAGALGNPSTPAPQIAALQAQIAAEQAAYQQLLAIDAASPNAVVVSLDSTLAAGYRVAGA